MNGALGGELLEAGSGCFSLFYCEKYNQAKLKKALIDLKIINFKFEKIGSKVIYIDDKENFFSVRWIIIWFGLKNI